jgi:hypothetical protein
MPLRVPNFTLDLAYFFTVAQRRVVMRHGCVFSRSGLV